MSIYRGWRYLTADVQQQDVAHTRSTVGASAPAPPLYHLRKAQPVLVLLPRTASWIASLPPRAQPRMLAKQFARIANALCAAWNDVPACQQCFEDLLADRRGGRQGFPTTVLRAYHAAVHRYGGSKWDDVEPDR